MNAGPESWMHLALRLARRGLGRVSPNPMVGAVLVADGRIVATGYHHAAGREHAEVDALRKVGFRAPGCDLYVNLEPCCHHGRTPPCTDAIVASGIRRVFTAMIDPNPAVSGRGIETLRAAGVEVIVGTCHAEASRLNEAFAKRITTGLPLVVLKLASTLDGRIADRSGASRWITSEPARRRVHRMRAESDAVLVGAGTARADNPLLLPVLVKASRSPLRVVVDPSASLDPASRLCTTLDQGPVLVAVSAEAEPECLERLRASGVEMVALPGDRNRVSLPVLMQLLGSRGVNSVLVEGGGKLAASLLSAGLVDRLVLFYGPVLLADPAAVPLFGDLGPRALGSAFRFRTLACRPIGPDWMIELQPLDS